MNPIKVPSGWRSASYSDELVPEAVRKSAVAGAIYHNPQSGSTLQKQADGHWVRTGADDKIKEQRQKTPDISKMKKLAEGNYGVVYQDPQSGHVVKTLKEGKQLAIKDVVANSGLIENFIGLLQR